MGERRGTKALELWCRRITDGYPGVNVQNMTTSWRDGLAFCAMIHHFRPDLIDFNSLNKDDVYGNNELAFRTAEQHLGIPALLDAEDMASCAVPDRLSILTYLSQFYQTFGGSSPSRLAMNRTTESSEERIARPVTEPPKPKVVSRLGMRRDPCAVCGLPVFLAEKLVIDHMPYHRTCFRCARCSNQLTPGNYYETEDGQYCCETCPDEEPATSGLDGSFDEDHRPSPVAGDEIVVVGGDRQRSLSDEEKTEQRILKGNDVYKKLQDAAVSEVTSQTAQMRLDFMANHLLSEKSDDTAIVADATESLKSADERADRHVDRMIVATAEPPVSVDSAFPDGDEQDEVDDVNRDDDEELTNSCVSTISTSPILEKSPVERIADRTNETKNIVCVKDAHDVRLNSTQNPDKEELIPHSEAPQETFEIKRFLGKRSSDTNAAQERRNNVYNVQNIKLVSRSDVESDNQHITAILPHDIRSDKDINDIDVVRKRDNTKDPSSQSEEHGDAEQGLSLVQKRLKMFENREKKERVERDNEIDMDDVAVSRPTRIDARERLTVEASGGNERKPAQKLHFTVAETRVEGPSSREDSATSIGSKLFVEGSASNAINARPTETGGQNEKELSTVEIQQANRKKTSEDFVELESNETRTPTISREVISRDDSIVALPEHEDTEVLDESSNSAENRDESVTDISANEMNLSTARGIDLSASEDYPEDLNPFNDEDEERSDIIDAKRAFDSSRVSQGTVGRTAADSSRSSKFSTNPFDSDEDDEVEDERHVVPPKPAIRHIIVGKNVQRTPEVPKKRKLPAPYINLNPFWSDEEEEHANLAEMDSGKHGGIGLPVPKPRTIKHTPESGIAQRNADLNRGGLYASNTSITSAESSSTPGGTYRKKKPAPPPPVAKELFPPGQQALPVTNALEKPLPSQQNASPRTTPRTRKSKPAPPPPMPTSSPYSGSSPMASLTFGESPIIEHSDVNDDPAVNLWEDQKTNKDEANRNRQSLTFPCEDNQSYSTYSDKSVQGKWKRKKGPAPPRPIPHRRKIKVMSLKDVKLELDEIELQQQGLEKQGVRLEQIIRDRCESVPQNDESSLSIDVEELVLELFALVNEKNELFRRQAELMLLKRQQRLEEEHAEVEYQIRCLMCRPEATKTDFDKQREESLIQRLVEIVERRNEIVECLEMDRRREVEEDRSIHTQMGLFAAKNKSEIVSNNDDLSRTIKGKKGKAKDKGKEKKNKSLVKKDADKDVDETEVKLKRHNKRKWF